MARIKLKRPLPKGYSVVDGKVTRMLQGGGGYKTGDQMKTNKNYNLVTVPPQNSDGKALSLPSTPDVRKSLSAVPRDEANLEAEKGETVLTDLNDDGTFELYDIQGNRHSSGGTPLNLPAQSFVFSDTAKAKLTKAQMEDMGVNSKKRLTPAKLSRRFPLNEYIGMLADPTADKISDTTADLMLQKNKEELSHLAFIQEGNKKFKEGVPLAAHPYLVSEGIDPLQFTMQIEQKNEKEAIQSMVEQLPIDQQQKIQMLQQFTAQQEAKAAKQAQGPPPGPPQIPAMAQPPQGMQQPQGMQGPPMAQGPPQQMAPPQQMGPPQQAMGAPPMPMMRYGGFTRPLPKAQNGFTGFNERWQDPRMDPTKKATYEAYKTSLPVWKGRGVNLDPLDQQKMESLFHRWQEFNYGMKNTLTEDQLSDPNLDVSKDGTKNWLVNQYATDANLPAWEEQEVQQLQAYTQALIQANASNNYYDIVGEGSQSGSNIGLNKEFSNVEGWMGDNMLRTYFNPGKGFDPVTNTTTPTTKTATVSPGDIPGTRHIPRYAPWRQDDMKLANASINKLNINKYYPHLYTVDPPRMTGKYDSWEAAAQRIGGLKAMSDQARGAFSGPQGLAAFTSKSTGDAMKGISDVIAKTNQYNVNTANKIEGVNAQFMAQAQQTNRKALDEYVNRVNATDQNYDNAMNAANTEITNMLANRLTNAANTYNLNTTYDNYQIDPQSGGRIRFPGGRTLTGSQGTSQTENVSEFIKKFKDEHGMTADNAASLWKTLYGKNSKTSAGYPTSTNNYYGSNYGSRYGRGYNAGYQGGNYNPYKKNRTPYYQYNP